MLGMSNPATHTTYPPAGRGISLFYSRPWGRRRRDSSRVFLGRRADVKYAFLSGRAAAVGGWAGVGAPRIEAEAKKKVVKIRVCAKEGQSFSDFRL